MKTSMKIYPNQRKKSTKNSKIPEYVLNEYNTVLENTKLSLIKKERKLEKFINED